MPHPRKSESPHISHCYWRTSYTANINAIWIVPPSTWCHLPESSAQTVAALMEEEGVHPFPQTTDNDMLLALNSALERAQP